MTTTCTHCGGLGFLNVEQIPDVMDWQADDWIESVQKWIATQTEPHDVCVCDCCGNGETWYGTPGEHYGPDDPRGKRGPYAYNGGLCECN